MNPKITTSQAMLVTMNDVGARGTSPTALSRAMAAQTTQRPAKGLCAASRSTSRTPSREGTGLKKVGSIRAGGASRINS